MRNRQRSARGTAELSVLVVAGSLIAGALFGTGLSRTSVDIGDGLTWFSDSPSGEVIQVNPATGRPEARIDVAAPGNVLDVAQYAGRLIVTNRTSGELVSFDLSSILTSGQRRVTPGEATAVLHHGDDVFLVDRERGTIAAIDPVSTDTLGEIWQSPHGISDAVVDGTGTVWSVDQKGGLSQLRWSARDGAFVTEDERTIDHSGARSALVGHEQGVTLFGPDAGIVVQVGTGLDDEVVAAAPRLSGEIVVPDFSPAALVPVSAPQTGTVAIVAGGSVHEVDVTSIGCERPDRPEAFQGTIYVPCPGDDKVVRLDPEGGRAGDDIELPEGGEPSLVIDDGVLLINVPGAEHGVAIAQDGTVSTIIRQDEDLPAVSGDPSDSSSVSPDTVEQVANEDVDTVPAPPPTVPSSGPTFTPPSSGPSDPPSSPGDGDDDGDSSDEPTKSPTVWPSGSPSPSGSGGGSGGPGVWPSDDPTDPPTDDALSAPTGVTATQLQSGEVQVTWVFDPAERVDGFTVQEAGAANSLATVSPGVRQASVRVSPGTHQFTVTALRNGETPQTSAPSPGIATADRPGAPSGVGGSVVGSASNNQATVTITWQAAVANGSPVIDYTVQAKDSTGTRSLTVTGTRASYQVTCSQPYCDPTPVTVSVTARNARGSGPAATASLKYDGPTPPPLPTAGRQLVASESTQGPSVEGMGTTTLNLDPGDWAGFGGTCTWTYSGGNQGGPSSGSYPCGAGSVDIPINTGYMWEPSPGTVGHSVVFHASNGVGSVDSASYSWTTTQPVLCEGCQIP